MREATLGGLSALDAPPSRKAPGSRAKTTARVKKPGVGPRFKRYRSRIILIVGSAGFCAMMVGIVLNATVLQKEHHPAPLFATAPPAREVAAALAPTPRPDTVATSAPLPVPATPPPTAAAPPPALPATTSLSTTKVAAGRATSHPAHPSHPAKVDAIARLLAGSGGSAGHRAAATSSASAPGKGGPATARVVVARREHAAAEAPAN